jgi:hypothetical protein
MTQLITGAPIWVWPLLVGLILVGMRARKPRTAPAAVLYLLPLLGILALRSVASLPAGSWIWVVFVVLYAAGVWIGYLLQGRWVLGRTGQRVQLAGENLTLVVVMLVFWANFVGGLLQAVAPHIYSNPVFHAGFAAVLALGAGTFAGRAVRVWRG